MSLFPPYFTVVADPPTVRYASIFSTITARVDITALSITQPSRVILSRARTPFCGASSKWNPSVAARKSARSLAAASAALDADILPAGFAVA